MRIQILNFNSRTGLRIRRFLYWSTSKGWRNTEIQNTKGKTQIYKRENTEIQKGKHRNTKRKTQKYKI